MRRDELELESPIDMKHSELESKIVMEIEGISELDKTKEVTTEIAKEVNIISSLQFEDFLEEV